ncbi:MAG: hydantoinase/oxoprolinase family protein [Alphaproteobacteria bacterium]|nr:hydantoinase/oxoprolinase family protein [Alphaproteobacteria bacterium]
MWQVGVDVGGTFTDVFACEVGTHRLVSHKVPSTPHDPSVAIANALDLLKTRFSVEVGEIDQFCHGTTVATNALIQRKGGKIALVTTAGFKDLLTIGRQVRPLIYDLQADYPDPLIPAADRVEVRERIGAKGEVLTELTDQEIERVAGAVAALEPDGVAICLLFAFLNPEHEQRLRAALERRLPDADLSTSHEVQPVFREFERFSTTVLNTYLQPVMSRYIHAVDGIIGNHAPSADIGINQSSGGLMTVDQAARFPVRTALSGPAAGVVGAIEAAGRSGVGAIITLDVGGTSTDVCLAREGSVPLSFARHVAGFPIRLPSVDVNAVGAGGGSLIHASPDGLMQVGPLSAGADPGAACYGKGGTLPTVTDANLVLGRLPEEIASGDMHLDVALARRALEPVAKKFGVSVEEAAVGALRIVASNMVRAIRAVSVERGHDPRQAVLVPYGGAGGLHAIEVAEALGVTQALVPPDPGILCARGLMVADRSEVFLATRRTNLDGDLSEIRKLHNGLNEEADVWLSNQRRAGTTEASADMRFVGQNYELSIDVPGNFKWLPEQLDSIKQLFHAEHERAYGHADAAMPIEIVSLRLTARVPAEPVQVRSAMPQSEARDEWPVRDIWFAATAAEPAKVVWREQLAVGAEVTGPAVIEQADATTLVWPGWNAVLDEAGNVRLEKQS